MLTPLGATAWHPSWVHLGYESGAFLGAMVNVVKDLAACLG